MTTKTLAKYGPLLCDLKKLQANLSFLQTETMEAFMAVWAGDAATDSAKEAASDGAKKPRCMCRHVSQVAQKKKPPSWVIRILGQASHDASSSRIGALNPD